MNEAPPRIEGAKFVAKVPKRAGGVLSLAPLANGGVAAACENGVFYFTQIGAVVVILEECPTMPPDSFVVVQS
jgi:hypothetical protein